MVVEYRSREVSVAKSGGLNHDTRFKFGSKKIDKNVSVGWLFPSLLNDNTKQPEVLIYAK